MIELDPRVLAVEEEIQRFDSTLVLLFNDITKLFIVAQDLRRCKNRINPWHATEPMLWGVAGIGEKTFWNPLFEVREPNAELILGTLASSSMAARDKERWEQFYKERAAAEEKRKEPRKQQKEEMLGYLTRRLVRGRKVFS